jgi:hypothetical protein
MSTNFKLETLALELAGMKVVVLVIVLALL